MYKIKGVAYRCMPHFVELTLLCTRKAYRDETWRSNEDLERNL